MIKITPLDKGIEINGISFPNNTLSFSNREDIISIHLAYTNKKIISAGVDQFINENDELYLSAQDVIDDLLLNNVSATTSGGIQSILGGTNITIDNTDPNNPIVNSSADDITVVANYSALPAANTATGEFYWCSVSQGTSWLPGSLGGTYYSAGLYYSNGVTWEFMDVPYQATQSEVNTGTNTNKFVTPATLTSWTGLSGFVPNGRTLTINGTSYDLSANRTWTVGDALVANPLSQFAATTSAQLAGVISDETGSGLLVFGTSPSFITDTSTILTDISTNTSNVLQTLTHNSSGVIAANFGLSRAIKGQSSTTSARDMALEKFYWSTATDATRKSEYALQLVHNGTLQDVFAFINTGTTHEARIIANTGNYATLQFYSATTKKFTFESFNDTYMSTWTAGAVMYFRAGNASTYNASISNVGMWIGSNASGQTPTSSLQVAGSFSAAYVAKTANYTATINDHTIDCTANSFTVTLPTAVGITGRIYNVKNSGSGTTITLNTTSGQTIDGQASGTVTIISGVIKPNMKLQSDGANWIII